MDKWVWKYSHNLVTPSTSAWWVHGCMAVWVHGCEDPGAWTYGYMGSWVLLVHGYGYTGVGDVTPLPAHRAPALHTTLPLTRAKRAAMQTRRMFTLTEPLIAPILTEDLWWSGPTPLSSRACTCYVEACIHISERMLGQSISKDAAINRPTDDLCLCVFGAGRGRVRRGW